MGRLEQCGRTLVARRECKVGFQTASPRNRLLWRRNLLFRNLFVESSYYLSALPTPCLGLFAEALPRSFPPKEVVHSKRVNVSQPPITTLCKRTACDADVLESNERREILFPLIHSVGRPYILVPYWSIAMRTGARFLYCPDFRTGKGKKPRVAETSRSRHVSK
jgi:hypothetical protein